LKLNDIQTPKRTQPNPNKHPNYTSKQKIIHSNSHKTLQTKDTQTTNLIKYQTRHKVSNFIHNNNKPYKNERDLINTGERERERDSTKQEGDIKSNEKQANPRNQTAESSLGLVRQKFPGKI